MDLTSSQLDVLPQRVLGRYECAETRNAAAILRATNPRRFAELVRILSEFSLHGSDLLEPGGQESRLAARLNAAFRELGWREARADTVVTLRLVCKPHGGEPPETPTESEVTSSGYYVDNFADRVALDVEWNAKDGNLDRDLSTYRSLYDAGLIDAAVLITRTQDGLRALAKRLGFEAGHNPSQANRILGTSTTTNMPKLRSRMTRGDSGGCPLLAVAICERTWDGWHAADGDTPRLAAAGEEVERSTLFD